MSNLNIKVKKINKEAKIPVYATPGSAACDLYACMDAPLIIDPGKCVPIHTGIAIAIPDKRYAAFIYARSGLGIKSGIVPGNCVGVIDSDYRGEIIVGLRNHSSVQFTVSPGDRIAQMVLSEVSQAEFVTADELDDTSRGTGGFGSTGR
jgi:dUTP pyrophosphatase